MGPNTAGKNSVPGTSISEHELDTKDERRLRLKLTDQGYRARSRAGLPKIDKFNRVYFVGRDVIAWFVSLQKDKE